MIPQLHKCVVLRLFETCSGNQNFLCPRCISMVRSPLEQAARRDSSSVSCPPLLPSACMRLHRAPRNAMLPHITTGPVKSKTPLPSPQEPLLSGMIHRSITHRSTPKMTRCLPRGLALGHLYVTQRVAAVQQRHVPNSNNKDGVRPSKLFRRPGCKSLPARGLERACPRLFFQLLALRACVPCGR